VNDFLFIHGGITKEFLENFRGRDKLYKLNNLVKEWLLNTLHDNSYEISDNIYKVNIILEIFLLYILILFVIISAVILISLLQISKRELTGVVS
jgi:hypothetical protein